MPQAFVFKRINSTGVTTVSISGFGMLHGVTMNQLSTGSTTASGGLVTIYAGTTTAASTDPTVVGIINPGASGVADYFYDAEMPAGITIQVGGVVAPVDMTVTYT